MADSERDDLVVAPYDVLQSLEGTVTRSHSFRESQQYSVEEWGEISAKLKNAAKQIDAYVRADEAETRPETDLELRAKDLSLVEDVVHRAFRIFKKRNFESQTLNQVLAHARPCKLSITGVTYVSLGGMGGIDRLRNINIKCNHSDKSNHSRNLYSILRPTFGMKPHHCSLGQQIKPRSMPRVFWDRIDVGSELFGIDYTSLPGFVDELIGIIQRDHSHVMPVEKQYEREMQKQDLARVTLEHLFNLPIHLNNFLTEFEEILEKRPFYA